MRLKTGLYETLAKNFVQIMQNFKISLKDNKNTSNSIKDTKNANGIERIEFDLTMDVEGIEVQFKVKMYELISS